MIRIVMALAVALVAGGFGAAAQAPPLAQVEGLLMASGSAADGQSDDGTSDPTQEDEIDSEWRLALSHMRDSAPRAALPHLERLVSLSPQTARFRLELARALYLIEDDVRALHHFELALGGELSIAEIATVNEYLRAMDRRKPWQGHARAAVVSHSNPWHRSGEEYVNIGGHLMLPLPPVERAIGLELGLGATHLPQITQDLHARVHVMATGQVFENSALNRWHLRGELGLVALGDYGQQISGGVTLQGAYGAEGRIMHGVGLYAGFQRRFGNRFSLGLQLSADQLRYAGVPQLDGPRLTAAVEGAYLVSPRFRLHGGVSLAHAQTEASFHRRSTGSLRLGGQFAFAGGTVAGLEAQLSHARLQEANPLQLQYGPERSNRADLTARLMHRDFNIRGFAPVVVMGLTHQASNVPMNAFSNMQFSVGATRSF